MKPGRENAAGIHIGAGLSGYVAELGAAFTCARLGLQTEPRRDHAPYMNSWLKVLRGDAKAIFTAASKAQEATDYLHDLAGSTPPSANRSAGHREKA